MSPCHGEVNRTISKSLLTPRKMSELLVRIVQIALTFENTDMNGFLRVFPIFLYRYQNYLKYRDCMLFCGHFDPQKFDLFWQLNIAHFLNNGPKYHKFAIVKSQMSIGQFWIWYIRFLGIFATSKCRERILRFLFPSFPTLFPRVFHDDRAI